MASTSLAVRRVQWLVFRSTRAAAISGFIDDARRVRRRQIAIVGVSAWPLVLTNAVGGTLIALAAGVLVQRAYAGTTNASAAG